MIGAIATDLSKAFDCLPHDPILEKLRFYGLSAKSISLLRSYLSSRYQRVKLGNTFSSWMGISAGVPQGSILGPMLFNIFMNDLVYAIKNCKMINYADNTKIYLLHSEPQVVEGGVNRDLESARLWFKENAMMANPKKLRNLACCSEFWQFLVTKQFLFRVLPNISRGRFFEPIFTSKKFDLYTSIYGINSPWYSRLFKMFQCAC